MLVEEIAGRIAEAWIVYRWIVHRPLQWLAATLIVDASTKETANRYLKGCSAVRDTHSCPGWMWVNIVAGNRGIIAHYDGNSSNCYHRADSRFRASLEKASCGSK